VSSLTGLSPGFIDLTISMSAAVAIFTTLVSGYLGDVIGRKKMVLIGALITIFYTYPFFLLLRTANPIIVALATITFLVFTHIGFGSVPAFLSERFPTAIRSSGTNLAYQLAQTLSSATFVPLIAFLSGIGPAQQVWPYVAGVIVASGVIAALAIIPVKEVKLEETLRVEKLEQEKEQKEQEKR